MKLAQVTSLSNDIDREIGLHRGPLCLNEKGTLLHQ
jgi:hypothetical protein